MFSPRMHLGADSHLILGRMQWLSNHGGLGLALLIAAVLPAMSHRVVGQTPVLRVCYAGSMGAVMDRQIFPAFEKLHHARVRGLGRGAIGLARQLAAGEIESDVFIPVTGGPVSLLRPGQLAGKPVPFARTCMVLAYCPHGPAAKLFQAAAVGGEPWYKVLLNHHLRFGRTDPRTDPQGRSTVLSLKLAQRYYRQTGLAAKIMGPLENPAQIFTETSLMFRLQAGQVDACITYQSQAAANHLPFIPLPKQVNLGYPAMQAMWYSRVQFKLSAAHHKLMTCRAQPLVFYATVLRQARNKQLAIDFVGFLRTQKCQRMLRSAGYIPISAKKRIGKFH